MRLEVLFSLQRTQEIDDFLLLLSSQLIETFDDFICLAAAALVISDGFHQVGRPSVMEEEDAMADAPQGSGAELVLEPCCVQLCRYLFLSGCFIFSGLKQPSPRVKLPARSSAK